MLSCVCGYGLTFSEMYFMLLLVTFNKFLQDIKKETISIISNKYEKNLEQLKSLLFVLEMVP